MKLVLAALALALGVAVMFEAQSDDSPGLGMIGLLLIAGAVVTGVRALRRR